MRYAWQIDRELDLEKDDGCLNQAVMLLNGKHNFEWLSKRQQGETRNPILELELSIREIMVPPPLDGMMGCLFADSKKKW